MTKVYFYQRKQMLTFLKIICFLGLNLFSVQAQVSQEYKVKAAFLYNLARMVEWPEDANSGELVMCFFGEESFGNELDSLRDKSVKGRALEFRRDVQLDSMEGCHILFISDDEEENLEDILYLLADSPVLTVGESDLFAERGGIVNLPQIKGRIRIEININAAQNAGLKMSSKLLTLAKIIE